MRYTRFLQEKCGCDVENSSNLILEKNICLEKQNPEKQDKRNGEQGQKRIEGKDKRMRTKDKQNILNTLVNRKE